MAAKLVRLQVVSGATQTNVTGTKNWAAIKSAAGSVTVEASTIPGNDAAEWKQITWRGEPATSTGTGAGNRRTFSLATSRTIHVEASLGGVTAAVDVWVLWATVEILVSGSRPAGAAAYDKGSRDDTDKLGPVTYPSISSSVIDEKAGVFVDNMGASGKVAPVATLTPKGVHDVVTAGFTFEREVDARNWMDGVRADSSTSTWKKDTSNPNYLRLKPDLADKIYDLDAPDLRWGEKTSESYNNFRQWITWNRAKCSDDALWYWQARWVVNRDPAKQIVLNDVGAGKHIALPSKPFYPPGKAP